MENRGHGEAVPLPRFRLACAGGPGARRRRDDRRPRPARGPHTRARGRPGAHPLRPDRLPLARPRGRPVPDAKRLRPLEQLDGRGHRRQPGRPLVPRQSGVDRCVGPGRVPRRRLGAPAARLLRLEPGRGDPATEGLDRRLAGDHPAARLAGRREREARAACVRARPSLRGHPPHRRHERLPAGPVGRDRPWHRALPRQGERMERHRLQLPRRQVRPGLRRSLRRDQPERRRRSRGGVQPGLGWDLGARELRFARNLGRGGAVAREASGVAARRCPRGSPVDADVGLRREPALSGRGARLPARDLRPPGHGLHRLPG